MNKPLSLYAVYGASGFGREIMPLARAQLSRIGVSPDRLYFIDDNPSASVINGQMALNYDEFIEIPAAQRYIAIAIANSSVRETLAAKLEKDQVIPWAISAANTTILDEVVMAEGGILCPFVTITSNACIGKYFHANIYSYVAHDCVIGDFVTFAPGVKCNGNVTIEDHAYIGTGAILRQGTPDKPLVVGKGAIVGMGAVVTKDVPPYTTVVGNPARPLVK